MSNSEICMFSCVSNSEICTFQCVSISETCGFKCISYSEICMLQCVSNFACNYESVPIILIGNKSDLAERRVVSVSEAKKVTDQ